MKIEREQFNYIIYVTKEYLEYYNFDFSNNATEIIKKLFSKINNKYNLNLEGFYDVIVYINKDYGVIIEMEKDYDEYIKVFGNKLDMKIIFKLDCDFYYEDELGDFLYQDKLFSKKINYENSVLYGDRIKDLIKI